MNPETARVIFGGMFTAGLVSSLGMIGLLIDAIRYRDPLPPALTMFTGFSLAVSMFGAAAMVAQQERPWGHSLVVVGAVLFAVALLISIVDCLLARSLDWLYIIVRGIHVVLMGLGLWTLFSVV